MLVIFFGLQIADSEKPFALKQHGNEPLVYKVGSSQCLYLCLCVCLFVCLSYGAGSSADIDRESLDSRKKKI